MAVEQLGFTTLLKGTLSITQSFTTNQFSQPVHIFKPAVIHIPLTLKKVPFHYQKVICRSYMHKKDQTCAKRIQSDLLFQCESLEASDCNYSNDAFSKSSTKKTIIPLIWSSHWGSTSVIIQWLHWELFAGFPINKWSSSQLKGIQTTLPVMLPGCHCCLCHFDTSSPNCH